MFAGPLGGSVRLEPGDVIAIAAGQVHQCNPDDGSWRYQMIHMDQEWAATLAGTARASALFSAITVLRRSELHEGCRAWSDLVFAGASAEQIEAGFRALVDALGKAARAHGRGRHRYAVA